MFADLAYVFVTILFFVIAILFAEACGRFYYSGK